MSVKVFSMIGKILKFLGHVLKGVFNIFFHEKKDENIVTGVDDGKSK